MSDETGAPMNDLPAELSQPAQRALIAAGCTRLDQVAALTEREIAQLHGVGPKAIRHLRHAFDARGLAFAASKQEGR